MPHYHPWHNQPTPFTLHTFPTMNQSNQRKTEAIARAHVLQILTTNAPSLARLNELDGLTFQKVQLRLSPSAPGPHILITYTRTTSYYGTPRTYHLNARIFLDDQPDQYTRAELLARILLATTPQDLANLSDVNPSAPFIF